MSPIQLTIEPRKRAILRLSASEVQEMKTAKEEVRDLLEKIPDSASLDEIQYHIYALQKIQKGLDAEGRGAVISQQEAERWMARWLDR